MASCYDKEHFVYYLNMAHYSKCHHRESEISLGSSDWKVPLQLSLTMEQDLGGEPLKANYEAI